MLKWLLTAIVVVVTAVAFVRHANHKFCRQAYGRGIEDAGSRSWSEIQVIYAQYVNSMRPMDAASYRRGLEYALMGEMDWQKIKSDFEEAFASGAITQEGTGLRRIGKEEAIRTFSLRVNPKVVHILAGDPSAVPVAVGILVSDGISHSLEEPK